jgi:hypothetical protein
VIARAAGGALETVIDGETGRFWSGGPDDLARAVLEFDDAAIDPATCRAQADRFSRGRFRESMIDEVRAAVSQRPIDGDGTPAPRRSWAVTAAPVHIRSPEVPATAGLIERAVNNEHR